MKLNGKQYDKFILNGNTYDKFYLNNKIYQSLDPGLILDLPLQNNFTDYSASGISMIAGNANGLPSFISDGSGGFALDFNGSQSIKTTTNLPINSDKITIAFWMKTTQNMLAVISELSADSGANNAFRVVLNPNKITIVDHVSANNDGTTANIVSTGNWVRIVVTIDRNQGISQNKIYINGALSYVKGSGVADLAGNFVNNILYIGQRAGNSFGFNGSLMHWITCNYPFTAGEVLADYNSFL